MLWLKLIGSINLFYQKIALLAIFQSPIFEYKNLTFSENLDSFGIKIRTREHRQSDQFLETKNRVFDPVFVDGLAWRDSFRTYEWEKACPVPDLIISQVKQLLALV